MSRQNRTRTAFTLTELLVVLVIIAVLACMLLPGVKVVRGEARLRVCANNLAQIGLAHGAYLNDYDGVIVPACMPNYVNASSIGHWAWSLGHYLGDDRTGPYTAVGHPGVLRCPTLRTAFGYGHNYRYLSIWVWNLDKRFIALAQVRHHATKVFLVDMAAQFTPQGFYDWQPVVRSGDGTGPSPNQFDFVMSFRHENRGNALMLDGHVETRRMGDGFYDRRPPGPTNAQQYWSID